MFNNIPQPILTRMRQLEHIDSRDRNDGTPTSKRLLQIPPDSGRFIAIMAASAPDGQHIEIGTSGGYSTLWQALACRATGRKMTTFEVSEEKVKLARLTFDVAGVADVVTLIHGDALQCLSGYKDIGFCFLDAEKQVYDRCYEAVIPSMVRGGLLLADNAISHREVLQPMLDRALKDDRVDALVVPIGSGVLVCRRK